MENRNYYLKNRNAVEIAVEKIADIFPCFVEIEPVEMGYVKISIKSREEDAIPIDRMLYKEYRKNSLNFLKEVVDKQ